MKNKIIIATVFAFFFVYLFFVKKGGMTKVVDVFDNDFKYFKYSEFDTTALSPYDDNLDKYVGSDGKQKVTGSGKKSMKKAFLVKLNLARDIIEREWNNSRTNEKIVFVIESGHRSQHFNDSLPNSVTDSAHVTGWGADISIGDYSREAQEFIIYALKKAGFTRFGFARTTVHVDCDPTKNKNRVWYYFSDSININPNNIVIND